MRGKKPRAKSKANAGPADVGRAAGCSRQLAARLLKRGMSKKDIIERIEENKRREDELLELPETTVNGHAAAGALTFSQAQTQKENWLAGLRRLEYEKKSDQLQDVKELRRWTLHLTVPFLQALRRLPGEMRIELENKPGPEVEEVLRERIEGCIRCVRDYTCACFEHAGQPLSDGSLDCGDGFSVRWEIVPPVPEDNAA
jgi:hypothetical protein